MKYTDFEKMKCTNSAFTLGSRCHGTGEPVTVELYHDEENKKGYQVDKINSLYRVGNTACDDNTLGEWLKLKTQ